MTLQSKKDETNSLIVYKVYMKGILSESYNCKITLENINSKKKYELEYLSMFEGYAYISNIPVGKYRVAEIRIPFSNLYFILREPDKYSNISEINKSQIFFLGSYKIDVIPDFPRAKLDCQLITDKNDIINILNTLIKEKSSWQNTDIDNEKKLFKEDRFIF